MNIVNSLPPGFLQMSQSLYSAMWGIKSIVYESLPEIFHKFQFLNERIKKFCTKLFREIREAFAALKFHVIQGVLIFGSGVCGIVAALHDMAIVKLGVSHVIFHGLDGGFFLFACIHAIQHYVKQYQQADYVVADEIKQTQKTSAILGLISYIEYLVGSILILFGTLTMVGLIFACIGALTGCIKTIFDYFCIK